MTINIKLDMGEPRKPPDRYDGAETPEMAASVSASCEECGRFGYFIMGGIPMDEGIKTYCPDHFPEEE